MPNDIVVLVAEMDIMLKVGAGHFLIHMLTDIEQCDPAPFIMHFFGPFGIVIVFSGVKVEDIFPKKDEFGDALFHQRVSHIALQVHDVVMQGVVPFADQFDQGILFVVIGVKNFPVQRGGAKFVPLRMQIIVVQAVRKFKFTVRTTEKGGTFIFFGSVKVTPAKKRFDIMHKATKIRLCIFVAVKEMPLKIVTTGPESAGKTALASALASALHEPCVPEFARPYLEHLGHSYQVEDLRAIGAGQKAWENWYAGRSDTFLVLDTDWTVLHIWETFRFGSDRHWREGYGIAPSADLYLLCRPDFPWAPDPLRENPGEREQLFELYHQLLQGIGAAFVIVKNTPEERLETALAAIANLSRTLQQ